MRITLQGYESRTFTDKETGELVKGMNVYYSYPDMRVVGHSVAKKFFSANTKIPELVPGAEYILEYDEKGRAVQFCPAPSERGAK